MAEPKKSSAQRHPRRQVLRWLQRRWDDLLATGAVAGLELGIVGGIGLVTALRLMRSRDLMAEHRAQES